MAGVGAGVGTYGLVREEHWWHVCDLQLTDGRLQIVPVEAIEAGTNPDTYPGCWPPGQEHP